MNNNIAQKIANGLIYIGSFTIGLLIGVILNIALFKAIVKMIGG